MKPMTTFMQIDLQNLFYGARHKGQRIDFEKVWGHFHDRENEFLITGIVYMLRSPDFDSSKFETKLSSIGYEKRIKSVSKIFRGKKSVYRQTNHDVPITIDCMDRLETFDKWILMSGDGDFADLCKYLRNKGKQVEIWSFKESHNAALEPYANRIHFIEDTFFYKKPNISVFGFTQSKMG